VGLASDQTSRKVLPHRVSISMDSAFSVEALEEGFATHGVVQIYSLIEEPLQR
jgi:putative transposase